MSSRAFRWTIRISAWAGVLLAMSQTGGAQTWHLAGRGGAADWSETPVLVEVKTPIAPGSYALEAPDRTRISAVVFADDDHRLRLGAILPAVPAQKPFALALKPQKPGRGDASAGVRFRVSGGSLDVTIDDRSLATYRVEPGAKPFFFPLVGPTGESFTRAYPMFQVPGEDRDHPHQRSCWFTHGRVNGVDFWSEEKGHGTIRETQRRVVVEGPVLARLRTRDDWLGPDGRPVCRDRRTVTVYRTAAVRIIDFDFTIEASHGPLTFGDTKEGMFGLRVASSMDVNKKRGGRITNAEGLTDLKAWGQASPWVDYVGPVKGQTVGIAILNHPDSFRFPTTWHVRDYGLFAANPFGWKDFGKPVPGEHTVPAGQTLHFAYRVILHTGDTASLGVDRYFQGYAGIRELEVRAD